HKGQTGFIQLYPDLRLSACRIGHDRRSNTKDRPTLGVKSHSAQRFRCPLDPSGRSGYFAEDDQITGTGEVAIEYDELFYTAIDFPVFFEDGSRAAEDDIVPLPDGLCPRVSFEGPNRLPDSG